MWKNDATRPWPHTLPSCVCIYACIVRTCLFIHSFTWRLRCDVDINHNRVIDFSYVFFLPNNELKKRSGVIRCPRAVEKRDHLICMQIWYDIHSLRRKERGKKDAFDAHFCFLWTHCASSCVCVYVLYLTRVQKEGSIPLCVLKKYRDVKSKQEQGHQGRAGGG